MKREMRGKKNGKRGGEGKEKRMGKGWGKMEREEAGERKNEWRGKCTKKERSVDSPHCCLRSVGVNLILCSLESELIL